MTTLVRPTDPETSHEAAASVADSLRANQRAVWAVLYVKGPCTDTELIDAVLYAAKMEPDLIRPQSHSGIRTRRKELVSLGLVIDTGQRDVLRSGRRSIVWRAVGA